MSGAVNTVANAVDKIVDNSGELTKRVFGEDIAKFRTQVFTRDIKQHTAAAKGAVAGDSVGTVIGGAFKPYVSQIKENVGEIKGAIEGKKAPVNIAVEDPAAKAEADKKARDKARRQAEIDILTDKPGRGGTILTDQYQYKV